jgi:hypothetical protein
MDRNGKHGRRFSGGVATAVRLLCAAVLNTRRLHNPSDLIALISPDRHLRGKTLASMGTPVVLPGFCDDTTLVGLIAG